MTRRARHNFLRVPGIAAPLPVRGAPLPFADICQMAIINTMTLGHHAQVTKTTSPLHSTTVLRHRR